MSDPGKYRTKDEIEEWRARDPLHRAEEGLKAAGLGEDELAAIDDAIVQEMDAAEAFADESPVPDPEHRFKNHYVEDDR